MALVLLLADGFEEIEALGTLDLLRRAGVTVQTLSIHAGRREVHGAHGITVVADHAVTPDVPLPATCEGVILPGGMGGAQNLAADAWTQTQLKAFQKEGKLIAAICAAPALVLTAADVVEGRPTTCYPAEDLTRCLGEAYVGGKVRVAGNLITAEGPGRFIDFAVAIIEHLKGAGSAKAMLSAALMDD